MLSGRSGPKEDGRRVYGEVESLIIFVCEVGFVNSRKVESCVGSSIQGGSKN